MVAAALDPGDAKPRPLVWGGTVPVYVAFRLGAHPDALQPGLVLRRVVAGQDARLWSDGFYIMERHRGCRRHPMMERPGTVKCRTLGACGFM